MRTIAPLLVAHVRKAEVERTLLKPPATWQAYHYFMRGLDLHLDLPVLAGGCNASRIATPPRAIDLD